MIYNPLIHINVLPRWNICNRTRVTFIHQTAMTNILTIWFMSLYIYTIKQALFSRQQHSISVSSIHIYWHSNALYARSYAYSWFVATSSISVPIINGPPEWEGSKRINRNGERHQHIVPRGHSSKTFSTIHIYIYIRHDFAIDWKESHPQKNISRFHLIFLLGDYFFCFLFLLNYVILRLHSSDIVWCIYIVFLYFNLYLNYAFYQLGKLSKIVMFPTFIFQSNSYILIGAADYPIYEYNVLVVWLLCISIVYTRQSSNSNAYIYTCKRCTSTSIRHNNRRLHSKLHHHLPPRAPIFEQRWVFVVRVSAHNVWIGAFALSQNDTPQMLKSKITTMAKTLKKITWSDYLCALLIMCVSCLNCFTQSSSVQRTDLCGISCVYCIVC